MNELIDRREVIKHIGDCLDNNGYVDTKKFAECMREILNMPYETESKIRTDERLKTIDKFSRKVKSLKYSYPYNNGAETCIVHAFSIRDIDEIVKQMKGEIE